MDFIIGFFRDVLDGPLYIIVTIICIILICSCIGYLAEQSINKKKKKQEYDATHATVGNDANQQIQNAPPTTGLEGVEPVEVGMNQVPPVAQSMPQQSQMGGMPQPMTTQQPIAQPAQNMGIPEVETQQSQVMSPQPQAMGTPPTSPMVANTIPNPNQPNVQ